MYRQYENPHKVEKLLMEAEERLQQAKDDPNYDEDALIDLYNEVESLRERVNFAWQDDEYDEDYAREMGYPPYGDDSWDDDDDDWDVDEELDDDDWDDREEEN